MEFFDKLIERVNDTLSSLPTKEYGFSEENLWENLSSLEVILQRDTAFELKGTGFNLATSSAVSDGVTLIGNDLKDIKKDCSFARITLLEVEEIPEQQKIYNLIKKTDYVKYHLFPEGYMMRSTSRTHKEAVRVSKKAIRKGISFEKVGNLFIKKYKEIPGVRGVRVIFVISPEAPFRLIEEIAEKSAGITETLNHIMNSVNFDCDSCNLKPICDEVEGMRELHFRSAKE